MKEEVSTIEDRLVRLFQELVSVMPAGSVDLHIKRAPEIQHDGVSVWLTPTNPEAAEVVADAKTGDSIVSMSLGKGTLIEVLPRKNATILDEVREISEAAIEGRFEEDLWLVGSEVTKCVGRIEIGGKRHVFRYFGGLYPFRKKEKKHIQYSPYVEAGSPLR